jgi:hypothetical protein
VQVSNTYHGIIDDLARTYGGYLASPKRELNVCKRLDLYRDQAAAFLQSIQPYVRIKQEQVTLALEFHEHTSTSGRRVSIEEASYRKACYERMKELKQSYRVPTKEIT